MKMEKGARKCVYCHLWDAARLPWLWIPFPCNLTGNSSYKATRQCPCTSRTGTALSLHIKIPLKIHLFEVSQKCKSVLLRWRVRAQISLYSRQLQLYG